MSILDLGFIQNALIAGLFLGLLLPFIGTVIILRRLTFLADSLGHINMSGIAFFIFLGTIFPLILQFNDFLVLLWAIGSAILIEFLREKFRTYKELSITFVYSFSVALTLIFINLTDSFNSSLFNILFGNILTISTQSVIFIIITTIIIGILLLFFYKKIVLFSIEEDFVKLYGLNKNFYKYFSISLIAATITLAIQVIGVLLVSSLLVIPQLTASNLARNLKQTIIFSIFVTLFSILGGILISLFLNIPTSAIIVLLLLALYIASLFIRKIKA